MSSERSAVINGLGLKAHFILSLLFLAGCAAGVRAAEPTLVQLDGTTLTVKFGDTDDWFTFQYGWDADTTLSVKYSFNDPFVPLLCNGKPILMKNVNKWIIDFGGGSDALSEPIGHVPDLWIYGGPGNDQIKVPLGPGTAHVYGGPGNDHLDAEHAENNFLYGEEGDDILNGSSDGDNYLDGGRGNNWLYSFKDSGRYGPRNPALRFQTHVYRQGSNDRFFDCTSGNSVYKFAGTGGNAAGSVTIMEPGGNDVMDFSAWPYPVNIDFTKTTPQVVSVDAQGNPVLTLQFVSFVPQIEKVIRPNTSPKITTPPAAAPNPTAAGQTVAFFVAASDADGDALSYAWNFGDGATGAGATPAHAFPASGTFSAVVTVSDGKGGTVSGAVTVTVGSANHAPTASNQSVMSNEDTAKTLTLAGSDPDGNPLTYIMVSNPAHGTLSGAGASRTYAPAANYYGSDSFTFKVNDGALDSNVATVSITVAAVNDAPAANAQAVTAAEDTAKAVTLSGSDVEGSALSYSIVAAPAHGTLSGSGASRIYTPSANYNGSDSFTFKVNDGALNSNTATVLIAVAAVNDAPVLASGPTAAPNPASAGAAVSFTAAASDADNDALAYSWNFGDGKSGSGASPVHAYSAVGLYTATVTASDGKGGMVSGGVAVSVGDANPPAVSVTAVVLKGVASDAEGPVTVTVNGAPAEVAGGVWTKEVAPADGNNVFTVRAVDAAGNETTRTLTVIK